MDKSSGSLISIVVPCYNCENTVSKTLDSFSSQTNNNFEIVLVDDGSRDSTGILCEDYAKSFHNEKVKVIHKSNGGLVSAWKSGVIEAKGNYILFCDADDYLANDIVERLYLETAEQQFDLIMFGAVNEYSNGKKVFHNNMLSPGIYLLEDIEKTILPNWFFTGDMESGICLHSRWTKLFSREVLLRVMDSIPNDISWGEDDLTTFATILKANKVKVLDNYYAYHYVRSNPSMTNIYNPGWFDYWKRLRCELTKEADNNNYLYRDQIVNDYFSMIMLYLKKEIEYGNIPLFKLKHRINEIYTSIVSDEEYKYISIDNYSLKNFFFAKLFLQKRFMILILITKLFVMISR